MDTLPTFTELIQKKEKSPIEQVLLQCIVSLSNHPDYSGLTMNEIYDRMVAAAKEIQY